MSFKANFFTLHFHFHQEAFEFLFTFWRHSAGGCDRRAIAQVAAQRSHPTYEVKGRSREDPMPKGQRPRGVTPRPRSGAEAESTRLRWLRNGERSYPESEVGGAAERGYPVSEVRCSSREELPHAPKPEARGCGQEEQLTPEARGSYERSYPEPWLLRHRRA